MRIMIHAAPARMWYVRDFLVPALTGQGIEKADIELWIDGKGKGNLTACMEAFASLRDVPGGTWHLQDDVIPAHDFAVRAAVHDEGVVAGYCCQHVDQWLAYRGRQPPMFLWYSFPCIRIPNELAADCADWFFRDARFRPKYRPWVLAKKFDDSFFLAYLQERRGNIRVENLVPCLVDHVDYLIGGSLVNGDRPRKIYRAALWEDDETVAALEKALKDHPKTR